MLELGTLKKAVSENEECFPPLTFDEFFKGYAVEDSIAPKDWNMVVLRLLKYRYADKK